MKKSSLRNWFLIFIGTLAVLGCDVTPEKIQLWKGTKNGPKKLAGTLIDSSIPMDLRASAAVALVEIRAWDLYREAFTKMKKEDSAEVIDSVAPILAKLVAGDGASTGKGLTKLQVDAKDALYIMLDYAANTGKAEAERALIRWCTEDYNVRAMAGQYNIRTIVKKLGAPAAEALIQLLKTDQIVVKYVAELILEVNDPDVLKKASEALSADLKANVKKIEEVHLVAASIIGGDAIASTLLAFATDAELSPKLQRYALRAFSDGIHKKAISLNDSYVETLFGLAENTSFDQYQREETYYVIAQAKRERDLPKIRKLMESQDSFWRAVAFRCLLRMDGKGQLVSALTELGKTGVGDSKDEVDELIARVASFPDLKPAVLSGLKSPSTFTRAVAVAVLAQNGTKEDAESLKPYNSDKVKLPKGFEHKTLGDAVKAAIVAISKRG